MIFLFDKNSICRPATSEGLFLRGILVQGKTMHQTQHLRIGL